MKFVITDANEDSHGIYAAEVLPTVASGETKVEGEYKDEVEVIILRKFIYTQNFTLQNATSSTISCIVFPLVISHNSKKRNKILKLPS